VKKEIRMKARILAAIMVHESTIRCGWVFGFKGKTYRGARSYRRREISMRKEIRSQESSMMSRKSGAGRFIAKAILAFVLCLLTSILSATTTNYQEPWTSSLDSWSFTQTSCNGTCADALLTSDGNPADGTTNKVTGRNKAEVGYWSVAAAWTALGVPSGDTVDSVDGQWDDKAVQTAVACASTATMGIQLFDSANTTELSASAIEPTLNVAGDTAAWTNHNPTGAVTVTSSNAASSTVTLRFNVNPNSGNNGSAACELRGDNFKLAIVSHAPPIGGGPRRVHISRLRITWPHTIVKMESPAFFEESRR
jgi:hypothetical protein